MASMRQWHVCKRWDFIKGPCPFRPLKEHEEEEYEDEGEPFKIPRIMGPERRRENATRGQILAEAEAVVREYIQAEAAVKVPEPVRVAAAEVKKRWTLEDPVISSGQLRGLFALALESALVVGASVLLAKGFGSSSGVALNLEQQLSTQFKRRSMKRGRGAAGQGFMENWTETLRTLATD